MGSHTLRTYSGRGSSSCWSGGVTSISSDPSISALQSSSSVSLEYDAPMAREEQQVECQGSQDCYSSLPHSSTGLAMGGNKNCPPPSHLTSTALELTETGKSRKVLDSLAYPLDGSGSRSLDAALNSSLTFVRELKFKEKRKVAREAGLGAEMASKMLSTAEKGRESIAFVLSIGLYLLCREDADIVGSEPVKALCKSICQQPAMDTSVSRDFRACTDSSSNTVTVGPGRRPSKLRMRTKSKQQQGSQVVESQNNNITMGDSSNEQGHIACARSLLDHSEILKWGIIGGRQSVVRSDVALHTLLCLAAADTTGEIREAIRVEGGLSEAMRKLCDWKAEEDPESSCKEKKMVPGEGNIHRLLSWLNLMELATHSCPASAAYVTAEAGGKEFLRCLSDMVAAAGRAKSYEAGLTEEFLTSVLRVLVNLTHHNPSACQALADVGGLFKLMRCFLAEGPPQKRSRSHSFDDGDNSFNLSRGGASRGLFGEWAANGEGQSTPVCRKGHEELRECGNPAFDAHVLTLTVLANCVELHSSVENRNTIAAMRVCEQCPLNPFPCLILDSDNSSASIETHSGVVSAIEYLCSCFLHKMKGFETQFLPESDEPPPTQEKETEENSKDELSLPVNPTESEDCMSASDVEDLILAGHLGMLLGCLAIGGKKEEVSIALDPSTCSLDKLVRVLHAFLSLHQHAEVLSTDIAVPILTLIRNLEDDDNSKEAKDCSQDLRSSSQDSIKSGSITTTATTKRVKPLSLEAKTEDGNDNDRLKFAIPEEIASKNNNKRVRLNVREK